MYHFIYIFMIIMGIIFSFFCCISRFNFSNSCSAIESSSAVSCTCIVSSDITIVLYIYDYYGNRVDLYYYAGVNKKENDRGKQKEYLTVLLFLKIPEYLQKLFLYPHHILIILLLKVPFLFFLLLTAPIERRLHYLKNRKKEHFQK